MLEGLIMRNIEGIVAAIEVASREVTSGIFLNNRDTTFYEIAGRDGKINYVFWDGQMEEGLPKLGDYVRMRVARKWIGIMGYPACQGFDVTSRSPLTEAVSYPDLDLNERKLGEPVTLNDYLKQKNIEVKFCRINTFIIYG